MGSSSDEEREMIKEPFLKNCRKKGGFRTLPFIIASGMLEKVANYGVIPNMTLYLMGQYHMKMTTASSLLYFWGAATNFLPVVGAIIADSCVGRFNMIGIGSVVNVLGMILLWLTSAMPGARPQPCDESFNHCSSATISQLFLLCTSLAVIAIGAGGVRASSTAFGANQLESQDHHTKGGFLEKYFGWYYATYSLGILIAFTCVVYIQDKMGWATGFGVCTVVMLFSALSFFLATPFYVKEKVKENLVTELIQVMVASCKKRHIKSSSENGNAVCHHQKGSALLFPTEKLRFLNKACIIQDAEQELTSDERARDPWSLCTVDQVEDLKSVLKVIPIWSSGILIFVTLNQGSFIVLQASSMNRKVIGNFEIPAGSFGTFSVVSVILWVLSYDRVILPIASRIRGKPTHFSTKQRMGAGIFLSFVCVMVTAVVESIRRSLANEEVLLGYPQAGVQMSAIWLLPQYCLMGIAEGLNAIAQNEFYISELPKSMSSLASTLSSVALALGNLFASFLLNIIDDLTKRGGQESWVSTNINKGHYDYYFWVLSGLSMANLMYFLVCCCTYGPCRAEVEKARDEED